MATIVQDYGPIYGEVVNGTVQGRPNGSVYVPLSNTISIALSGSGNTIAENSTALSYGAGVNFVAQSQDLSSYVAFTVYSDSGCTTAVGNPANRTAGQFNGKAYTIGYATSPLTSGVSYYLRAQLMNNGVAVATSNVIEVVAS